VRTKSIAVAGALLILVAFVSAADASSDAGLDVTFKPVQIRVVYSVALDYNGVESCIRDSRELLFDIIALLQAHPLKPNLQQDVLQFELYRSSKKPGNLLSLDQNPFKANVIYKTLYDGRAKQDLKRQILSLLKQHLKLPVRKGFQPKSIKLYKCEAKDCDDILFGSFPSEEMHTGYCATPGKGCDSKFTSVTRDQMHKFFITIPE
jgi:hypothetical protein